MVRVTSLDATLEGSEISLWMRYPSTDYEKEKEEAIQTNKRWLEDPRFSNFKIRLRDCIVEMGKILEVNEVISEEPISLETA